MADYIPHNDDELVTWAQNFIAGLTAHAVDLGVDVGDITTISTARTALTTAISDQAAKRVAAKTSTTTKNTMQEDLVTLSRAMARRVNGSPNMTDAIRQELGLTVPDRNPTAASYEVGEEVPLIRLEAVPGKVIVHFGTDPSNERKNSRPAWATGCTVYRRKAGETSFQMVGFQKISPLVDTIEGAGCDYTYIVRYQGRTVADQGANSSEATIAANGMLAA